MINILSKQDRRFLTILELLFKKKTSTLKELTLITRSNRKTIQEDLQNINSFIEPLVIATSTEGCALLVPDSISIDYIYACIIKNSVEFSILESFFFEKHNRLEDYADALFISLSTLKRTIVRLNNQLKKYNCQIKTGSNQIVGDEASISALFMNFFSEKYFDLKYPFNSMQTTFLDKLFKRILKNEEKFLNFSDLDKLQLFSLIALVRIQNGHKKEYPDISLAKFDVDIWDDFLLKKAFKSIFKIELTETNMIRLFYPFVSGNFFLSHSELLIAIENDAERTTLLQNIRYYIAFIQETFQIELAEPEKLELEMYNTAALSGAINFLLYNKKKHFIDNLVINSPLINQIFNESGKKFSNPQEKHATGNIEEFLYMLIIHWPELALKLSTVRPLFQGGIFMTSDTEHSDFIATVLNKTFTERFNFSVITENSLSGVKKEFGKFDLIVTNISNLKTKGVPSICMELYPSQNDFKKIALKYGELSDVNNYIDEQII